MSTSQQQKNIRSQKNRRRRRKRRRLSAFAWILIVFILLAGAGGFAAYRYLKVTAVDLTGKTKYSNEQILAAAGIRAGDRIFAADRSKAAGRITAQLPYIKEAQVKLWLFTQVKITVTPDTALVLIKLKDGYAVCDKDYKVLETVADTGAFAALPVVAGVDVTNSAPGTKLKAKTAAPLEQAQQIYDGMKRNKVDKVRSIDVSNSYEISFNYDGRITVVVGTYAQLDRKLWYASKMLQDKSCIRDTDKGTLDVSQSAQKNRASFIPS